MLNQEEIMFLSTHLPIWDKMSQEDKDTTINSTVKQTYMRGEMIHGKGFECAGILVLIQGEIRAYVMSEDGREITLYRTHSGDICMLSASCSMRMISFDMQVEAEQDTTLLRIPPDIFSQMVRNNIHLENYSYRLINQRLSDMIIAMQQVLLVSFDKRLATFLIQEHNQKNSKKLYITHEQIAKYIGSAREVVSRMLKDFEHKKMVTLSRGCVTILNIDKLNQLIAE